MSTVRAAQAPRSAAGDAAGGGGAATDPLVRIQQVSKHFEHRHRRRWVQTRALDDVSLDIAPGQFVAIIGPSGCGKSTLLRLLDGLMPPAAGSILLDGRPVTGPGPDRAMVFQQPNLLPWRTVEQNIRFGMECLGIPADERTERAARYLQLVGLEGFERYFPAQLSGGMQQRVGLARAFAAEPQILLLDEPFGALDAQTRIVLQEELARILAVDRRTAILVTHDMEEAVFLADVVVVMSPRPGRIVETLEVDLPRPRDPEVRVKPRFTDLKETLWETLRRQPSGNHQESGEP